MLPHLPSSDKDILALIEGLLRYPPKDRLKAKSALENRWLVDRDSVLLPFSYPLPKESKFKAINSLDGFTLGDILDELVQKAESTFEQSKQLRDEWD
jgi:hypothetical protein